MSRDKRDEKSPVEVPFGDESDSLDEMLLELYSRGLFDVTAEKVPETPQRERFSREDLKKAELRLKTAAIRTLLRAMRAPCTEQWFGQWLRQVRTAARVKEDDVAALVGFRDPALWRRLEEVPVQVASLKPEVLAVILDLFGTTLPSTAKCMWQGLERKMENGRILARSSHAQPFAHFQDQMRQLASAEDSRQAKVRVTLEKLLQETRALLERSGRQDLLEERPD